MNSFNESVTYIQIAYWFYAAVDKEASDTGGKAINTKATFFTYKKSQKSLLNSWNTKLLYVTRPFLFNENV